MIVFVVHLLIWQITGPYLFVFTVAFEHVQE